MPTGPHFRHKGQRRPRRTVAARFAALGDDDVRAAIQCDASLKDAIPFARKTLAGESITAICEPVTE